MEEDSVRFQCFVSSVKYDGVDDSTIEFARDIIKDSLPLKHLHKICNAFRITPRVSYADDIDIHQSPKKYGLRDISNIDLIVMHEHYIADMTIGKSFNAISNRTIWLSTLIATILHHMYA